MKKSALTSFKQLNNKEMKKVKGGEKYYVYINGVLVEIEF